MASLDISKLQEIINSASDNDARIKEARKAVSKVQAAFDELAQVLAEDYQPVKKERKPRAEGTGTGTGRRGRPKKNADPNNG